MIANRYTKKFTCCKCLKEHKGSGKQVKNRGQMCTDCYEKYNGNEAKGIEPKCESK